MKLTLKLPDLSLTRGELPPDLEADGRAHLWGRRVRQVAGWGALGVFFFLLFAWISLPTRAIAWRISHEAYKAGYKVDIEDLSIRPWGTVVLHDVKWTFEPTRSDTPPNQYLLEDVYVSVGLFDLLSGDIDVEVETARDEGTFWARYERTEDQSSVALEIRDLPLYDVPKATQALGVPLMGLVVLSAELTMPEHKFSKADGKIAITCAGCRAGDGEAQLFIPGTKNLSDDGLTIPEIDLGTVTGTFVVEDGSAVLDPPITSESEDLTFSIDGKLELRDPFARSLFDMILKVALSESFQERSDRVRFMYHGASTQSKLDPPEQGLGFKLRGSVGRPKFYGIKALTPEERRAERRDQIREREERRRQRLAEAAARRRERQSQATANPPVVTNQPAPNEPRPGEVEVRADPRQEEAQAEAREPRDPDPRDAAARATEPEQGAPVEEEPEAEPDQEVVEEPLPPEGEELPPEGEEPAVEDEIIIEEPPVEEGF